jgi:hypothetical protein
VQPHPWLAVILSLWHAPDCPCGWPSVEHPGRAPFGRGTPTTSRPSRLSGAAGKANAAAWDLNGGASHWRLTTKQASRRAATRWRHRAVLKYRHRNTGYGYRADARCNARPGFARASATSISSIATRSASGFRRADICFDRRPPRRRQKRRPRPIKLPARFHGAGLSWVISFTTDYTPASKGTCSATPRRKPVESLSNEKQVTERRRRRSSCIPVATAVCRENSVLFYLALAQSSPPNCTYTKRRARFRL